MTVSLSHIFKTSTAQAFRGLTNVLKKSKAQAEATDASDEAYLNNRLYPDMNDMKWQVQMITEFAVRGAARMSGIAPDDLPNLPMEGDSFDALIERVESCAKTVADSDDAVIDGNGDLPISLPIGPEQTLDIDGKNYVTGFYIPNLFFHVTTAYNLARTQGAPVGKKDYMGM